MFPRNISWVAIMGNDFFVLLERLVRWRDNNYCGCFEPQRQRGTEMHKEYLRDTLC